MEGPPAPLSSSARRLPPNGATPYFVISLILVALQIYIDNGTYKSIMIPPNATAGGISRILRGIFTYLLVVVVFLPIPNLNLIYRCSRQIREATSLL